MSDLGFSEEQERRARERQLVLLGAALASKELRVKLQECYFADAGLGSAFQDLTTRPSPTRIGLRQVMADLGLSEWDVADGSPLDLLIEHVRLDAKLAVVWRDICYAISSTNAARALTAREKADALERTEKAVNGAHKLLEEAKANGVHSPSSKQKSAV